MKRIFLFFQILAFSLVCSSCEKQISEPDIPDEIPEEVVVPKESPKVIVSSEEKQQIKLGIDAERLWYWRSNIKEELAQLAVKELHAEYIRVAISCAYEPEEGVYNENAYEQELEMMNAMKTANPDINFFASPRPLDEAYSKSEKEEVWGHEKNVPWSPYPAWIQEWYSDGTKKVDGIDVPRWKKGNFHVDKLVQYYANYLNLMKEKGFDITYLDASNEQTIITPSYCKYLRDSLPVKLAPGVNMPLLIAPSTWNVQGGINWLDSINTVSGEQNGFDIASVHNTGSGGVLEEFTRAANSWGKAAWNTELHGWIGVELQDEILNSAIFWEHIRAGFSGIDTWLFFGPDGGKGHTMIWSHWNNRSITKSGKYEIFKQVVNNANGGKYVEVSMPSKNAITAAFIKENTLSLWILNKSSKKLDDVVFELANRDISGKIIDVVKWQKDLPRSGAESKFAAKEQSHFSYDIDGQSLYFFKIMLNN
ncbi:hypothetical protein SAMN05444274_10224 [Mariniphaga anaerophila]|uniref:O-Glycosyl hydrolase n=1 Tax=Mariniphaga anaerophila TaxID=1484053 RepID=A0A1M4V941_9BACT|nr:hypothetical protein [Mariniphaga anaerophila]SHE65407.1 hypothetical protein SAMN05444274_10224 [Mariniphaga anaerophila]